MTRKRKRGPRRSKPAMAADSQCAADRELADCHFNGRHHSDGTPAITHGTGHSEDERCPLEDRMPDLSAEEIAAAVVRGSLEVDPMTDERLLAIAKEHIPQVETFREFALDRMDFITVFVTGLRDALRAAYEAGRADSL